MSDSTQEQNGALCGLEWFGIPCCLPRGHWGFHKSYGAMEMEKKLAPEACEALERQRWETRRELDS